MEKFRPLKLKNLFFHILYAWRIIIICLILCVSIAFTYSLLSSKLITNTNTKDINIKDVDSKNVLGDEKIEEARVKFLSEDVDAKAKLEEIQELEKEIIFFQKKLDNDYYLQIDPSNRMNKSFILNFELVEASVMDEERILRIKRELSCRYMQALSGNGYLRFITSNDLLDFNEENIRNLYRFTLNSDGLVYASITGPSELIINQIIQCTRDYIEKEVHVNIDMIHMHNIIFEDNKSEIVKDKEIPLLIQELNSRIHECEQQIENLNAELEEDFILSLKDSEGKKLDTVIPTDQPKKVSVLGIKNIILVVVFGLLLSFIIILIKFWKDIRGLDIFYIAKYFQVPYLGILYYKQDSNRKDINRFGRSFDRLLIRLFDMEYNDQSTSFVVSYLAQILNSKIDDNSISGPVRLLMPRANEDAFFIRFLDKLQRELDTLSNLMGSHILVQAIGNISDDLEAIRALIDSEGLILLWDRTSSLEDLILEKQKADNLDKKICGVLELQKKY